MVQRVYERAARAAGVARVMVATDDQRVFDAVTAFGGDVAMTRCRSSQRHRPHRRGRATLDCDVIVNVQGDEPLLRPR